MDFTTIMKYLEQGFTLEQIEQMKTLNDKNSAQPGTNDKTPANDNNSQSADSATPTNDTVDNAVPVWADSLGRQIEKLTHTIQAQALANTNIPTPKDIQTQADEILANIINPTKSKE